MKMHFGESWPPKTSYDNIKNYLKYRFLCGNNWYPFSETSYEYNYLTDDPDEITCKTCAKLLPNYLMNVLSSI